MLNALPNLLVIAVVVLVLLILIAIPLVLRFRRANQEDVLPPPELGQQVDYTALPYEEPQTLSDRLRQAPVGVKLLLALVPIAIIIAAIVLWLTFFSTPTEVAEVPTPTPVLTFTNAKATLTNASQIAITADTNIPNTTSVTASMKEGDQDFPWFIEDRAVGEVRDGQVTITLERSKTAPAPARDKEQSVTIHATIADQVISSEPIKVTIPQIYATEFYRDATTPTPEPTAPPTPTVVATVAPTDAPAEPTATPESTLTATVFNGGNIRSQPRIEPCTCPQIHAGEVVTLLERTADGQWYRVHAPEGEGWVSATLLTIDDVTAQQVPTPTPVETGLTGIISHGGNVRERPVTGRPLDQANAGETVQLHAKTADGGWYQITTPRNITGWISVTLLRIDPDVARQVPIAQ